MTKVRHIWRTCGCGWGVGVRNIMGIPEACIINCNSEATVKGVFAECQSVFP